LPSGQQHLPEIHYQWWQFFNPGLQKKSVMEVKTCSDRCKGYYHEQSYPDFTKNSTLKNKKVKS